VLCAVGCRTADSDRDELMLKWAAVALALALIAACAWANLDFRPIECTQKLDSECIRIEIVGAHG
jgi:hypothetical protein